MAQHKPLPRIPSIKELRDRLDERERVSEVDVPPWLWPDGEPLEHPVRHRLPRATPLWVADDEPTIRVHHTLIIGGAA